MKINKLIIIRFVKLLNQLVIYVITKYTSALTFYKTILRTNNYRVLDFLILIKWKLRLSQLWIFQIFSIILTSISIGAIFIINVNEMNMFKKWLTTPQFNLENTMHTSIYNLFFCFAMLFPDTHALNLSKQKQKLISLFQN